MPPHFCGTFKVAKTNNPYDFLSTEQVEFDYKKVNAKTSLISTQ